MSLDNQQADTGQAERIELDALIERGFDFTVPKRSLLRFTGKPDRTFIIQQPYLGTLDALSSLYLKLHFSQQDLEQDPLSESKRLMQNARLCARIIAVAVLNNRLRIQLLTGILTRYLLWRVTPKKLFELTLLINEVSNLRDFIGSIRYLAATPRTTSPNLMEEKSGEPVGLQD